MATKRKPTSKSGEARRSLGRATDQAAFPALSPVSSMPSGYVSLLRDIKQRIQQGRVQTVLTAKVLARSLSRFCRTAPVRRQPASPSLPCGVANGEKGPASCIIGLLRTPEPP